MAFDISGARNDGYTDAQIADHLAQLHSFDISGARNDGYTDPQIADYLAAKNETLAKAANAAKALITPDKVISDLAQNSTPSNPAANGIQADPTRVVTGTGDRAMDLSVNRVYSDAANADQGAKSAPAPDTMAAASKYLKGDTNTSPRVADVAAAKSDTSILPEATLANESSGVTKNYGSKMAPARTLAQTYTDLAKDFMSGMAGLSSATGQAEKLVGLEKLGTALSDEGNSAQQYWLSLKSPYGREQDQGSFIKSGDFSTFGNAVNTIASGNFEMGDASPATMAGQAVQSLPGMLGMGGVGAAAKAGLIKLGAMKWATGLLTRVGISAPAAAKVAEYTADGVSYGGSEGVFSGLQNASQTGSQIRAMGFDDLKKSPTYNEHLAAQDPNLPEAERMNAARNATADDAEALILRNTIVTTGGISALTGGGVFGVLERGGKGIISNTARGIVSEGLLQEFPQSGIEQYWQNKGMKIANPSQDLSQGVAEQAIQGGVVGGLMGVGGSAAGVAHDASADHQPDQTGPAGGISAADVLGTPEPVTVDPNAPVLTRAAQAATKAKITPQNASILPTTPAATPSPMSSGIPAADAAAMASDAAAYRKSQEGTPALSNAENAGHPSQVILPDNTTLPAQWEVVDADSVKASLKEGVAQPRDRTRAAGNAQVQGIANAPDYRRLADSPVMDIGAPTISQDGAIVGGNGRFEGVSQAYDKGTASAYLQHLKADAQSKGIDPAVIDTMSKPVLVRRITVPFDTRALAVASNSGGSLQYSALETAKIDGERMKALGDIQVNDTGDIAMTGENMQNIRQALNGYSAAELGSMTDKDGMLSQEGIRRIKNAMLYKAYGNSPTLSRLVESTDNDLRSVSGALMRAAGSVSQARAAMAEGTIPAGSDIAADLVAAVEILGKIKADGGSVEQYLAQHGLFKNEYTQDTATILQFLSDNIRSQKKMADFIRSYYDALASEDHQSGRMFADMQPPTKNERLNHVVQNQTQGPAQTASESAGSTGAQDQQQSKDTASAQTGGSEQSVAGTRAAPIPVQSHADVKIAEQNVNTSPSDAQKEAGNYAKGHIHWQGIPVTIENPQGSKRTGTDRNGKDWSVAMPASYGYIKRTEGADGEHIDVYIGKDHASDHVYVIDQLNLDGTFDEHKVMLAFPSEEHAIKAYKAGFSDGKGAQRIGAVTPMTVAEFKDWTKTEETTNPVGDIKPVLESYTAKDIAQREAAQNAADKAKQAEENLAKSDQAAKDAAEVKARTDKHTANADNFVFGETSKQAAQPVGDMFARDQAKQEFDAALQDAGALLRKLVGTKMIVPEDSPELMKVLVKLFESAFKMGYYDLKAAAKHVRASLASLEGGKKFANFMSKRLMDDAAQQAVKNMPNGFFENQGLFSQPAAKEIAPAKDEPRHVQDRITNADNKSNPGNYKPPALHTFVDEKVLHNARDLIEKYKVKEKNFPLDPEDVAVAEKAIQPIIDLAIKNLDSFTKDVISIAQESGIGQMIGKAKTMDRALRKMLDPRELDYAKRDLFGKVEEVYAAKYLRDALRATIVVNSYDDVDAVIKSIEKRFTLEPGRTKIRWKNPTAEGYRDVLLNVVLPDGLKAEIQINIPKMLAAKDFAHELYNISRDVSVSKEVAQEATDGQVAIYDAAFSAAMSDKNTANETGKAYSGKDGINHTSLEPTLNTLPSGKENIGNPSLFSKNLDPAGNLAGSSETGNLSGTFISSTSTRNIPQTITKEYSSVNNTTSEGTDHVNEKSGTQGAGKPGSKAAGGIEVQQQSGSVFADNIGRDILANSLPDNGNSQEKRTGQGGIATGPGGNTGKRGSSGSGNRAGADVGVPAGRDIPAKTGRNYQFTDADLDYNGAWLTKAKQNMDAVQLVKKLEAEGRQATREEQSVLAKFMGWGASEIRNKIFGTELDVKLAALDSYDEAIKALGNNSAIYKTNYAAYRPAFEVLHAKDSNVTWYTQNEITRAMLDAAKPDPALRKWAAMRDTLKSILTDEEWKTAERSTQYAHYTGKEVVREMWRAADRFGFKGGSMLEPGAGIGAFPGLMDRALATNSIYTGIEFDQLTGAILKQLQPDERILVESYIDSQIPDNFYDIAIGNPPFSGTKILSDPAYKKQAFALHDYFFAKTMDKVKLGGLVMFVTSRYTMDKQGDKARQYLAERADLLGAVRLPETAFKKNAGTEVVTDILFLRKKVPGQVFEGHPWMALEPVKVKGGSHMINEYFAKHPDMVLGESAIDKNGMYAQNQYTVHPDKTTPITDLLAAAIDKLPADVYRPDAGSDAQAAQIREFDWNPKAKKPGNYYVNDAGKLMQVEGRAGVVADGVKAADVPLIKEFINLREAVNQAQYDQLNDGDWEKSLKDLQKAYKTFTKKHGLILQNTTTERVNKSVDEDTGETVEDIVTTRKFPLLQKLRDDPEYTKVMALESINDDTGEIKESQFLHERVLEKSKSPVINTPHDALLSVLNDTGTVDLPMIAERIGINQKQAIEALGDSIYDEPGKGWVMSDEYLSGNVKKKLAVAITAAKSDRRYERNVAALQDAQPNPVPPSDITASIGMNWISGSMYADFLKEKAGVDATITYNEPLASWSIKINHGDNTPEATVDWGTGYRSAGDIMDHALSGRPIRITTTDRETKKSIFLADATEAANQKLKQMRDAFKEWFWQDETRADAMVKLYNDKFNNMVARKYDGRHLTLPGTTTTIKVFDHVKRGAWRVIQSGNTYLAHAVGSGKTWEMVISAMEQKRLGMINKPMMVVPNHMLQQFAQEWLQLYPAARLMVADETQFHTDNRRRFVSRVAMSDLDGVIITHSAFKLLDIDPEFKQKMLNEEIAQMEAARDNALAEDGENDAKKSRNPKVRQMQARIEQLEEKVKASMSGEGKDKNVRFDEMGVDMLYVDEAHEFRKLAFSSSRQVKGIDTNGSERARDLFIKSRWLEEKHPGRSLVFASGTPITNTLAEIYHVQRFMQPKVLAERGLEDFDAWASMFGEESTEIEADASGKYANVTRFSKFINVPELTQMFREFADVLTSDHLAEMLGDKRPKVAGGNMKIHVTPEVKEYLDYKEELAKRLTASRLWKPSKDEPNNPDPIIRIIGDGRLAAIDMRFINPGQPSNPGSKLNQWTDGLIKTYNETTAREYNDKAGKLEDIKGSTMMGFSDLGFGAGVTAHRGFNARAWVEKRLRDAGIPPSQVAFMADYKKSVAKVKLFKDVNAGKVRILIGSSKNMGTGVNAQQRLYSIKHLDTPWFPADLEQRNGRGLRQGNKNPSVELDAYSAKGSYDTVMWQLLARKQGFIDQALSGDSSVRTLDDISEVSQFQMATAMTAGDERAIRLAGLKADIDKYDRLYRAHEQQRQKLKQSYAHAGTTIEFSQKLLPEAEKSAARVQDLSGDNFKGTVGKEEFTKRKEFGEALLAKLANYIDTAKEGREQAGQLSGFPIDVMGRIERFAPKKGEEFGKIIGYQGALRMKIAPDRSVNLAWDKNEDAVGMVIRATNALAALKAEPAKLKQAISDAESKRFSLKDRLDAPFQFTKELTDRIKEASELEAEMTAVTPASVGDSIVLQAQAFAEKHHGDQKRRFTGAPYITHPAGVVEILRGIDASQEMMAAAWAHDTVEDTKATIEDVRAALGDAVADLVAQLTKPAEAESADAQTVKLADIIQNVSESDTADKSFLKRYLPEKDRQIDGLTNGNHELWKRAKAAVREEMNKLAGILPSTSPSPGRMTVDRVTRATAHLRAAWSGQRQIHVVQSMKDLPLEMRNRMESSGYDYRDSEALYDSNHHRVYLIADELVSPDRAVWAAIHEVVGHSGLRMLDQTVAASLDFAGRNKFVRDIADAMAKDSQIPPETAIEEAVAEISAAIGTNNFAELKSRYGVNIPIGMRSNLAGMIKRVMDAIKAFIAKALGKRIDEVSSAELRGLIAQMRSAVTGKKEAAGRGPYIDNTVMASSKDALYQNALRIVKTAGRASGPMMMRQYGIKPDRAYALIKHMLEDGYITPESHVKGSYVVTDKLNNTVLQSKKPITKPEDLLRKPKKSGIESDTSLVDKVFSLPFKLVHWDKIVGRNADALLGKIGELIPEGVKAGIVSDHGLDQEYKDSKADMQAREAAMNRKSMGLVETLAGLNRAESRVAYYWMQEQPGTDVEKNLMAQMPANSQESLATLKKLISDMGKEAVRLGQMSQDSYDRNNMAYLHRTYAKHVLAPDGWLGRYLSTRATKIKGNQYKGRGIFDDVTMAQIGGDTINRKLVNGQADKQMVGRKLVRFERRDASTENMDPFPGMTAKPIGKLRDVIYWPTDEKIPAKYGDWVNAGTFEIRDTKGDKLVLWRDLTPEERNNLGELDEVRYAVAQTLQMMIHDIETGRFLEWMAKKYGKVKSEGKEVEAHDGRFGLLAVYGKDDWVQIPSTNIPGTQVKRYGAAAGLYFPGPIWNDLRQTAAVRIEPLGKQYASVLRFWKKSKALALDTPIPTVNGWTTMGEIQVGAKIFDEQGKVCEVLHTTPVQYDRQCYEVEFSDGTKIVADEEHLWFTIMQKKPGVRTTKEVLDTLKEPTRGDNNHLIPVAGALELSDVELPIPAYALGAWLGDGTTRNAQISSGGDDVEEMIGHLNACGVRCGTPAKDKRNNVYTFQMKRLGLGCIRGHHADEMSRKGCRVCNNEARRLKLKGLKLPDGTDINLQTKLRTMGLAGNKHIPSIYLRASVKQRRELLQGLMDTDGHILETGMCLFSTSIPALRDGALELIRSLGYKPTAQDIFPVCNGKPGKPAWRISFKAYANTPVFKLARKLARQKALPITKQRSQTRQIVSIVPVDSVPVRCIAVSSESKLYLAGEGMIPTHNTAWSPTVHMNNIMANFVMADWNDVRAVDLADALKVWALSDKPGYQKLFHRFEDSGAMGGMFLSNEVMRDEIKARLEEMKADLMGDDSKELGNMAKVLHLVALVTTKPVSAVGKKMTDVYQSEDAFFRLAVFLKAIRYGKSDIEAGRMARHAFLNYDINAPWIQYARKSFLPFVSFFYRALPLLYNTAKTKPWKIAKLITFAHVISALGYAMAGGGGGDQEKKDRKLMPADKSGSVWGLVPKMVKMPWNHDDGAPVFLDIRRWVPVGDIVDMNMGSGVLPPWFTPGGPAVTFLEAFMLNKSMFTQNDIVKESDSLSEKTEKQLDYIFKSMMPNIPVPNPLNLQIGGVSINPFGLDQGSFQSYSWSAIEKAVNRQENAIGETKTLPESMLSTVGVKLSAFPRDNMEAQLKLQASIELKDISSTARKIARDYSKLEHPTPAQTSAMQQGIQRQKDKMEQIKNTLEKQLD